MADRAVREALTELLGQIQDGKEVRAYLNRFGSADRTRFAIFKLGGAVLQEESDTIAASLSLLHTVGLTPIVVHGAGPQLDEAIAKRGVDAGKADGLRITTPAVMEIASTVATRTGIALAAAVARHGGAAAPLSPVVVKARLLDEDRYGLVGEPETVDTGAVTALIEGGVMPILPSLGTLSNGRLVNINADAVARALAMAFEPLKIVFVTGTGGLLDQTGALISSINLDAELDRLVADGIVHSGMRLKLEEIRKLLDPLPRSTSVSITSPKGLVRELFTHGGSGTLVRRGNAITRHDDLDTLDHERLRSLIEDAFGRTLTDDYFDTLSFHRAYVAADYRAAAILTRLDGTVVLDKFAVSRDARGEGLSHTLWRLMGEDETCFFWRSRQSNRFNDFYSAKADGFVSRGRWRVFWAGRIDLGDAAGPVAAVAAQAPSFLEDPAP